MNIDKIFLPCAGKGTRMGPLGQIIPKPLWPVFDSSILDINIQIYTDLFKKEVIINTHHLSDCFDDYPYSGSTPERIFEKNLLGSGGAFHNLKNTLKKGQVFTGNPDSILLLSKSDWAEVEKFSVNYQNTLIALPVAKSSTYNRLRVESGIFKGVEKPTQSNSAITYSGYGFIDLDSFDYVKGTSGFFDTVINPSFNKTGVYIPKNFEYWDFGTIDLYKEKVENLLSLESKLRALLKNSIDKGMRKEKGVWEGKLLKVKLGRVVDFEIYSCESQTWHKV